jgi:hypothetical protein
VAVCALGMYARDELRWTDIQSLDLDSAPPFRQCPAASCPAGSVLRRGGEGLQPADMHGMQWLRA